MRLVAGLLLIAESWAVATLMEVPYIKVEPGSATNVIELISVDGTEVHPPQGQLLFLTVSLSKRLTPLETIGAWLDDDVELVREQVFTGDLSREELTRINLALMRESKLIAIRVALEHLGYDVEVLDGAIVTEVLPDWPAAGKLEAGDVIVAVDGESTRTSRDVIDAVRSHEPGDTITMTVERGGETETVEIRTVASDEGVAQIGILMDDFDFEFPFEVDIDTGRVGGPSAGLAFTLAVLDELTMGELTGGQRVAVTGAIKLDGAVVAVGGVEQKAVAARHAGAAMMIVPEGEAEQAEAHAGDMQVVGVSNLEDALAALDVLGGNALALPRPRS